MRLLSRTTKQTVVPCAPALELESKSKQVYLILGLLNFLIGRKAHVNEKFQ